MQLHSFPKWHIFYKKCSQTSVISEPLLPNERWVYIYFMIFLFKLSIHTSDTDFITWWRHKLETFSELLVLCEGNPPATGGFPSKMYSLIRAWTNGWISTRDAGDLRRHRDHHDVTVMTRIRSVEAKQWKYIPYPIQHKHRFVVLNSAVVKVNYRWSNSCGLLPYTIPCTVASLAPGQ